MIGWDSQFYQLPALLIDHLMNDLLQPFLNRTDQHATTPLWAKDEMVANEMHTMSIMLRVHLMSQIGEELRKVSAAASN